jgi:hypothetical protein
MQKLILDTIFIVSGYLFEVSQVVQEKKNLICNSTSRPSLQPESGAENHGETVDVLPS